MLDYVSNISLITLNRYIIGHLENVYNLSVAPEAILICGKEDISYKLVIDLRVPVQEICIRDHFVKNDHEIVETAIDAARKECATSSYINPYTILPEQGCDFQLDPIYKSAIYGIGNELLPKTISERNKIASELERDIKRFDAHDIDNELVDAMKRTLERIRDSQSTFTKLPSRNIFGKWKNLL